MCRRTLTRAPDTRRIALMGRAQTWRWKVGREKTRLRKKAMLHLSYISGEPETSWEIGACAVIADCDLRAALRNEAPCADTHAP
eukprot:2284985-Pyramimonas_sp.AAC.1